MISNIQVVQPTGVLDGTQLEQFHHQISEAINAGASTVLVDLAQISFMDSSGLGALVSAFKTMRARGGELCVCSLNEQVRILFELTSMDRVMQIFENREAFAPGVVMPAAPVS
ncbi:MAG: STAS domain-containing protein [Kaiparowitsia implicata GSE-PSE-MK54-09C]|jgi:anti-anti-sigma factor|nr:STAS domain-containing protein [Kaiparowitsia implicata GSE-PSE-MK54-09C]